MQFILYFNTVPNWKLILIFVAMETLIIFLWRIILPFVLKQVYVSSSCSYSFYSLSNYNPIDIEKLSQDPSYISKRYDKVLLISDVNNIIRTEIFFTKCGDWTAYKYKNNKYNSDKEFLISNFIIITFLLSSFTIYAFAIFLNITQILSNTTFYNVLMQTSLKNFQVFLCTSIVLIFIKPIWYIKIPLSSYSNRNGSN